MTEGLVFDSSATRAVHQGGSVAGDRVRLLLHKAITMTGLPVRIPAMGSSADLPLIRLDGLTGGKVVVSAPSALMMVTASRLADDHPELGVTDAQAVLEAVILSWTIITVDSQRIPLYGRLGATAFDVTDT